MRSRALRLELTIMSRVFRFNTSESFHSEDSAEFAQIILQSPPQVIARLLNFGMNIEFAKDAMRVSHDGRKVGIGSFASKEGEIHFVIAPKFERLALKNLFSALDPTTAAHDFVHFENVTHHGDAQQASDEFTPSFLLALLNEIVAALQHLLNATQLRKEILVQGGIKGRPLLEESYRNLLLGTQSGFLCQVPEERGLRYYALILLATAKDIGARLDEWGELIADLHSQQLARVRYALTLFGVTNPGAMTRGLLYKLARPPFPFGLKDILYKCLSYWQWRGAFSLSEEGTAFGYWGLIVELDRAFETYVGHVWHQSSRDTHKWLRSPLYDYVIEGFHESSDQRRVNPDHLFINHNAKRLIVVDAKYREVIGTRDQVYQMISYLDFDYPELSDYQRTGILVFPGDQFVVRSVSGFHHPLYCMEIPVEPSLYQSRVTQFLEYITSPITNTP